jgi:hypothetical protein
MKLSDIEKTNSIAMNNKMRDKLGWNLNLSAMTINSATSMMESIDQKLAKVRNSHKLHESQNNPNYVGMLMAKQILESFVFEAKKKKPDADGDGVPDWADKKSGKDDKTKKSGMSDKQAKFFGKGKKSVKESELSVDEEDVDEPMAVGMSAAKKQAGYGSKPAKNLPKAVVKKGHEIGKKIKAEESFNRSARSRLFEDELGQAQAMLAAKDMVDSMQDMIEDLSKMLNEQLPPLTDSIRTAIGSAEADSFKASASSTLSSLLTTVQSSRESMDQAVRSLSGEPGAVTVPGVGADMEMPDMGDEEDMTLPDAEDDFAASDAAVGGDLPLGREKR